MEFTEDLVDLLTTLAGLVPLKKFFDDTDDTVDYSFIDENFHYPQQQRYCNGDYTHDPKITTPPGLYYLGAAYNYVTNNCDLQSMRFVNFLGAFALSIVVYFIRTRLQNAGFLTLSLVMNPLLSLYYSLFYTDVWSTVFIVAAYAMAVCRPFNDDLVTAYVAAFFGGLSCFFRQNNIVWTGYVMMALLDARAQAEKIYKNRIDKDLVALYKYSLKRWQLVVPFVIDLVIFALFVAYNGGLTLGDKQNHTMSIHLMQLFYCAAFAMMFTLPLWFSFSFVKSYLKENFLTNKGLFFNVIWIPIIALTIREFTVIHPFVLSDNRHYTFYIVRKFILRDETARYDLVPVYHFSCYVIWELIKQSVQPWSSSNSSLVMFLALFGATALVIVPTPLFEPRYYILPYFFYRIMINPSFRPVIKSDWFVKHNYALRLTGEVVWSWFWTQALYEIFLTYTFDWPSEENPQRIIW